VVVGAVLVSASVVVEADVPSSVVPDNNGSNNILNTIANRNNIDYKTFRNYLNEFNKYTYL
jgi:hypothetical protein